jgi:uncharacterized protein YjiK
MGLRVFVSYARGDYFQVKQLVEILREGGHDPWMDHGILPGQDWKAELSKAIRLNDVFLYAITPRSIKSDWCRWEFQEAMLNNKSVMPVLLEDTADIPAPLNRYQYADFRNGVSMPAALKLVAGLWQFAFQMQGNLYLPEDLSGEPSRLVIHHPRITRTTCTEGSLQELMTLKGHVEPVQSVAFNANSRFLASASWDNTVRLWEVPTGRYLAEDHVHFDDVLCVAFSSQEDMLASASKDRTISLWNLTKRYEKRISLRGHSNMVMAVDFGPDGDSLVSGGAGIAPTMDCSVRLWDLEQKSSAVVYTHTQSVTAVAYARNERYIAASSDDHSISLGNLNKRNRFTLLNGHQAPVKTIAFSSDGLLLASGGRDNAVKIWSIPAGNELVSLRAHTETVTSVAFSPDSTVLASASKDRTICLWEIPTGKLLLTLKGHTDAINGIAFSPDGAFLASASRDNSVRLWGIAPSKPPPPRVTGEIRRITQPIKPTR